MSRPPHLCIEVCPPPSDKGGEMSLWGRGLPEEARLPSSDAPDESRSFKLLRLPDTDKPDVSQSHINQPLWGNRGGCFCNSCHASIAPFFI